MAKKKFNNQIILSKFNEDKELEVITKTETLLLSIQQVKSVVEYLQEQLKEIENNGKQL